jgi:YVTN family beta-propeller protein
VALQIKWTTPVGRNPQDVVYATDGDHAYTANVDSRTISVLDTRTGKVTATLPTSGAPTSIAVTTDGATAYVTDYDTGNIDIFKIAT